MATFVLVHGSWAGSGSFFRSFRTPALYRIDRSCSGRHPKPFRAAGIRVGASTRATLMSLQGQHRGAPRPIGAERSS